MSEVGAEQSNSHSRENKDFRKPQGDPAIAQCDLSTPVKVRSVHGRPVASSGVSSALCLSSDPRSADVVSEHCTSLLTNTT